MKFRISLIAITITILTIDSTNAQTENTQDAQNIVSKSNAFISIQKELPDANLYRMKGHWIMRATSDENCFITREHISLEKNDVLEHHYVGIQKVHFGVLSHIKDNKVLQSVGFGGEHRIKICLYQDDKIMIRLLVINDKQVLVVFVKASETSHIDENDIRDVISKNILNKPNVRALVEDLVKQLLFVNQNHPSINYAIEDPYFQINIAESDLVDCDLTKSVGKWKLKGVVTGKEYKDMVEAEPHLNGDQLVIDYIYSKGHSASVTFNYVNSKIIRFDVYGHKMYDHGLLGLLYVDDYQFISYGKSKKDGDTMGVYCRHDYNCSTDYLKGVIDNLLLFTNDVKREIKDLVPKLVWR